MKRNRASIRKLLSLAVGLLVVGGCALADWYDSNGRGLFPYWQTGGDWYTLLTFVNTSEETDDVIYIWFSDVHGERFSDAPLPTFSIRHSGMLIVSTTPAVPNWIPVTSGYGYIVFRVQGGGFIQTFCVIHNQVTGTGYTVPAYHQEAGF